MEMEYCRLVSSGTCVCSRSFQEGSKDKFFSRRLSKDPHTLFNAGLDAKTMRSIDFHEGDTIDESALKELIRIAVAHNVGGKKDDTTGK